MMKLSFSPIRRLRREDGGITVEFAIIFPILMLLVFGIIDLSHAWYMRHLMSDASREGGPLWDPIHNRQCQRSHPADKFKPDRN